VTGAVSIRRAGPHDAPALARLAALDSAMPLRGEILLAEVDGSACAALSLSDSCTIADPFLPTAGLVALLAVRAEQLRRPEPPGRGRRWLRSAPQLAR
jgi:hypothetical protein